MEKEIYGIHESGGRGREGKGWEGRDEMVSDI